MEYEENEYGLLKLDWLGGFEMQSLENGGTEECRPSVHFPWKLR